MKTCKNVIDIFGRRPAITEFTKDGVHNQASGLVIKTRYNVWVFYL